MYASLSYAALLLILIIIWLTKHHTNILNIALSESIFSSVVGSLIFFTFVGAGIFLITLRRPHEDILENRIRYVFRNVNLSPSLWEYVRTTIVRAAAVAMKVDVTMTVGEYNESIDSFRTTFRYEHKILNLLHDINYVDNDVEVTVFTEDTLKDTFPDYSGPLGEILMIRSTKKNNPPHDHIDSPIILYDDYRSFITLEIDPDSTLTHERYYWLYTRSGEPYSYEAVRYCLNLTFRLRNRSGMTLVFSGNANQPDPLPRRELPDGSDAIVMNGVTLKPDQNVSVVYEKANREIGMDRD